MNETIDRAFRREAERRLAQEVGRVLNRRAEEALQWQGSSIDLMEALHVSFTTGCLHDSEGCYLSFIDIVSRVCTVLHQPVPRNPYECAARGRRRKGMYNRPYLERYTYMLSQQPDRSPLWELIHQGS